MQTIRTIGEQVYDLKLAGYATRQIAHRLTLPVAEVEAMIADAEAREAARLAGDSVSAVRARELARLDRYQTMCDHVANYDPDDVAANRGRPPPTHREKLQAVKTGLAIQHQRARLQGLYEPEVVRHEVSGTVTHRVEVAELAQVLAALPDDLFASLQRVDAWVREHQGGESE